MKKSTSNKVFVLGLDGGTFRIINRFIKEGIMPNIGRIIENGVSGNLKSTYPPLTPTAWSSFMTGMNPGRHGIYDWLERIHCQYAKRLVTSHHLHENAIWSILSRYERKVGVINVPLTYPPKPVNGFLISGMDTTGNKCTYPKTLYEELIEKIGDYIIEIDWTQYKDKSPGSFIRDLTYCTEKRLEATLYLMERYEWDFFMTVFVGMDRVQHFLWKYLEPDNFGYIEDLTTMSNEIKKYYGFVDKAVGEIYAKTDQDTNFIIVSDHGFKPLHATVNFDYLLREQGYLVLRQTKKALLDHAIPFFHAVGINRERIINLLGRIGLKKRGVVNRLGQVSREFGTIDWSKTKAFHGSTDGIYLNLIGREPEGSVNRGDEYNTIVQELSKSLKELEDPLNGNRIVNKVLKGPDIYRGHKASSGPDIVVDFGEYPYASGSPEADVEGLITKISYRTGTHETKGIFIATGPPFKQQIQISGAEIIDVFPTILHIMNIPIPEDIDGKVLTSSLKDGTAKPLIAKSIASVEPPQEFAKRTRDEEKAIEECLRALGYMD